MPMCMYTKSIIRKQFRTKCDFVCIPLRNFMGAPAPGAPMLPTPVKTIMNSEGYHMNAIASCRIITSFGGVKTSILDG